MLWEKSFNPDDPKPVLKALLSAWHDDANRVFALRAGGIIADPKAYFTSYFGQIGHPVALAEDVTAGGRDNQRTGAIWMEVRYDPKHPDAYRHSANAQPLHTDGSYIAEFPNATLMTCVANAGAGGETTFIRSEDIVACLKKDAPQLLDHLSSVAIRHARSGDARCAYIIDCSSSPVQVNWNYYCLAPDLRAEDRAAAEAFFAYLQTSDKIREATLAVKLGPGDAITWKDREVLHGRNGFTAGKVSERFIWKCAIDIGHFHDAGAHIMRSSDWAESRHAASL